ncbi:MAG: hypothetical protein HC942_18070 [Microcoleus sp. SU_5_6]|nr:hypothetical protein [Microcoleus sp. SU_5_6]
MKSIIINRVHLVSFLRSLLLAEIVVPNLNRLDGCYTMALDPDFGCALLAA